ncbi:MAG: glycosyltransferase [Candidatus Sumerlaeia bacterium]|nr:glycosyltransferase [Candidatus Sumerlaeia bacterium]
MKERPLKPSPTDLTGQRWVLLQTAPWGHVMSLPGHHLARYLTARGATVAYLSVPVSPWHFMDRAGRTYVKRRWSEFGSRGRWVEKNLFVYIPRTLLPVHHRPPFDGMFSVRNWLRFTFPNAVGILQREGFGNPDVMLVQNLQFPGLEEKLAPENLVYTVEDDIAHFRRVPPLLHGLEKQMASRANLVTATAHPLVEKMKGLGAHRVHYHPNGVDWSHFRSGMEGRESGGTPVAVYIGALDVWFDEELVAAVARALPHWKFILAGPPRRSFPILSGIDNVELPGPVPREKAPELFRGATAGIIPFKRTPLTDAVCPLKLFEYLAAGLPVVSTRMTEMENLASPAILCNTAAEFSEALVASTSIDDDQREELSLYARGFDWESLFDRLVQALWEGGNG